MLTLETLRNGKTNNRNLAAKYGFDTAEDGPSKVWVTTPETSFGQINNYRSLDALLRVPKDQVLVLALAELPDQELREILGLLAVRR